MKFDLYNVYTALNADKVEIGSKGYFADSLSKMRCAVEHEYSKNYGKIAEIRDDSYVTRFKIKDDYSHNFFYPAEEPDEKRFHPYKSTEEMIAYFHKYVELAPQSEYIPNVWVKELRSGFTMNITGFGATDSVIINGTEVNMAELFDNYVYADGMPCGIKE